MEIVHATPEMFAQWDDYVLRSEDAGFYHRFAWREVNEQCFGHRTYYLAAMDGGRIRGIFPIIFLRTRLFGKILCSLPFVNFGGPCADDPETLGRLVEEGRRILQSTGADYLEIRSRRELDGPTPALVHKVSMTIDLAPDPDLVWARFTSKHRNTIRGAYRTGLTAVVGGAELLDPFYEVLAQTWRNLGTPLYAKSYFKAIAAKLSGSYSIFLLMHQGRPVATAFNGLHRRTVEGLWSGTLPAYRKSDGNYVLYWEMIKHYCEHGYATFHLGRSTAGSGAEAFKKKWLARPAQLYWQYFLGATSTVPQLNRENPRYQLAIEAWRRTPLVVTRMLGPLIARGIP